jgi:trimeric autotransporter adhesin
MADKKPIRTVFNSDNVATGLAEFQTGETVGLDHGGTGVALSIGTAGQVIKVNSDGNALEFGAVEAIINIDTATNLTGQTLVSADQFMVSDNGTEGRATLGQIGPALTNVPNSSLTNSTVTISDDSSTTVSVPLGGGFTILGGSGITTSLSGSEMTITTDGGVVTETSTDILTNKSISGSTNTLSNIANTSLSNSSVSFGGVSLALGASDDTPAFDLTNATSYPTSSLVGTITNAQLNGSIENAKLSNSTVTISDDSSTAVSVPLGGGFTILGGSGITTSLSGSEMTIATDGGVVTETSTDTLTNKSISGSTNTLSAIANSSLTNSTVTISDDSSTSTVVPLGAGFTILGGSGINTSLNGSEMTIVADNVPTSSLSGTISNDQLTGSIANTKLSNSSVTVGSTSIALGATATTLAGITDITAGSINIAGNVIKSVDSTVVEIGDGDGLSVAGNLTVAGNFTVSGDTTTLSSTNTVITDKLYELANGTTGSPTGDAGIVIERGNESNAFIGYDESEDKFKVGVGTFTGASTGNLTITTGTLIANIEGNVSGALTGNADTATALASAVNIAGQSFDGSGAITIASTDLSNSSAIALLTAAQTFTNKTLTSPKINEDVVLTATATELNYTDGVTSAIQSQLNDKAAKSFAIAQAVALG